MKPKRRQKISIIAGSKPNLIKAEGSDTEYMQGIIRMLWIKASDLRFGESYDKRLFDTHVHIRGLAGIAKITTQNEKIGVIGSDVPHTDTFPLSLRCSIKTLIDGPPADPEAWNAYIGWNAGDWESGREDEWCMEFAIPEGCFDRLVAAHVTGRAKVLLIGVKTNLWASTGANHRPLSLGITWYLRPGVRDGNIDHPEPASGTVEMINWAEALIDVKTPAPSEQEEPNPILVNHATQNEAIRDKREMQQLNATLQLVKSAKSIFWALATIGFILLLRWRA